MKIYVNMMIHDELPFLDYVCERLLTFCDRLVLMDNGSVDGSREWLAQYREKTHVIFNQQTDPPHYSNLRNRMLEVVPDGAWVLKWDPDELPSDSMVNDLRDTLGASQEYNGWHVPIWHLMKSERTCLPMEIGFAHLRLFRKIPGVEWRGAVHEQPAVPGPCSRFSAESGIAVIHFSYFAEARLERKAQHYAEISNSGFTDPSHLTSRLSLPSFPLPVHVTFQASNDWLEEIGRAK